MKKNVFVIVLLFAHSLLFGQKEFSTAGFFELSGSGRSAYSLNPNWLFHKGKSEKAYKYDFDDTKWELVSLPHGIEELPEEASGCVNYQGEVWYRKHFKLDKKDIGKKIFIYFEAIMGKSKIWVNGKLLKENFGGYLPVIVDVSKHLLFGKDNVISVLADNSDDPNYPPGKEQAVLDFTYFGGIYRDAWLVTHGETYITDPNYEDSKDAGLTVSFNNVSEKKANIHIDLGLKNEAAKVFKGKVSIELFNKDGKRIAYSRKRISISESSNKKIATDLKVRNPQLWSPDSPYLYDLHINVLANNGKKIDGYKHRVGIRSIEFKGKDGFWLNGKPYGEPLIGANRHQDFAVIGNALPNSLHWRDAKKLKEAGIKVIRNAHYPQDPAFMDACDELGLFVIVNTPGWQFWSNNPLFEQRVYSNIRNMVRRDKNRASLWMWEPVLNETWYPDHFAKNCVDIVKEEFPYENTYTVCDDEAKGREYFPVLYGHPQNGDKDWGISKIEDNKNYFTREWGDNVDDWNSHNSPSRVSIGWGEVPMLVQAKHYAKPDYQYTCYDVLYKTNKQHVGGCLWHSFDHQRGYHPDPFYGGLLDAFRQPKYSYYMFMAQRKDKPVLFIANALTPFSPKDISVYSNCDEVRLKVFENGKEYTYKKTYEKGMPSPIITFPNTWDFMADKKLARSNKHNEAYIEAKGYVNGKLSITNRIYPSRRPDRIELKIDNEGLPLIANGGDIVTVIASVVDKRGITKRLNDSQIVFSVDGNAEIVGTNTRQIKWGTAPLLIRATTKSGKITVRANLLKQGKQTPLSGSITINSIPEKTKMIYDNTLVRRNNNKKQETNQSEKMIEMQRKIDELNKKLNEIKLKEIEKQQEEFGEDN